MNTRTPLAPDSQNPTNPSSSPLTPTTREPAALDEDLRRFGTLSPMEQLERLEADGRRITAREREMRAAESQLNGKGSPDDQG